MDQSKALITATYLITKEDYVNLSISKLKIDRKNPYTLKQKIISFIMVILLSLWFFRPGENISIILCAIVIILGYFLLFFFDIYMAKKIALSAYEQQKNNMLSQTFILYEDSLSIKTDKYIAKIPFEMLYKVYEDDKIFTICTSIVNMKFIPKRTMDKTQCTLLRDVLQKNLKDNFVKF